MYFGHDLHQPFFSTRIDGSALQVESSLVP